MPRRPCTCMVTKVTLKPTTKSQKCQRPSRSESMRPRTLGTQSQMAAKMVKRRLPTSTKWKWATTKYESLSCQLKGATDNMIPVRPAHRNWKRKAQQKSMGVRKTSLPPYIVPSQLKILMPVGTEISMVESAKKLLSGEPIPTVNMWCAHTDSDTAPMETVASTMVV